MSYRSSQLEGLVAGKGNKKLLFVLNKIGTPHPLCFISLCSNDSLRIIDMCPREPLAAWASFLRSSHPTLLFRSSSAFISEAPSMLDPALVSKSKGKAKAPADDAWGEEAVLSLLKQWAEEKENREGAATEPLQVAVIGVTNVSSCLKFELSDIHPFPRFSQERVPSSTPLFTHPPSPHIVPPPLLHPPRLPQHCTPRRPPLLYPSQRPV